MPNINSPPDVKSTGFYQSKFKEVYSIDLDERLDELRHRLKQISINKERAAQQAKRQYQANIINGIVSKIAEELSKRGFFAQLDYVKEKTRIAEKMINESEELVKVYREQNKQYLEERRKETLKTTRQHNWLDWFTWSDSTVIERFAEKMEKVLRAEITTHKNVFDGEGSQNPYSLDSETQSTISSDQQKLEEELATLARQFAVFYLSHIYGPAIYQKPLLDEPEPMAFSGSYPHSSVQPEPTASLSCRLESASRQLSEDEDMSPDNITHEGSQQREAASPEHIYESLDSLTLRLQDPGERASDDEGESVQSKNHLTPYNSFERGDQHLHSTTVHSAARGGTVPRKPSRAANRLSAELTALVKQNIGATAQASKQLLDKLSETRGVMLRPQLKALVKAQLGLRRLPATKALFREGFYRKGIIVMWLYACGLTPEEMADIDGSGHIIEFLKSSTNYTDISLALKNDLDYNQWDDRDRRNYDGFLEILTFSAQKKKYIGLSVDPMTILAQLNDPQQRSVLFRILEEASRENRSLK